jgi:hypothetical protein
MLDKDPKKRPAPRDLPREIGALEKAIPGLDKSSLWELVEGGEPTLPVPGESPALSLEPTGELGFVQTQQPPAQKSWDTQPAASPSASQKLPVTSAAASRQTPITGIGLGTMALALVLCVVYIVFFTLQPTPENKPDPQIEQLRTENAALKSEIEAEKAQRAVVRAFLAKAAQRLREEQTEDDARAQTKPPRAKLDEIMGEVGDLRASHNAAELPGTGD